MSKPWEQEWRVDEEGIEDGVFDVVDNDRDLVATAYAPLGRSAEGIQEKRTRLLAAAPDMARAGLDVVQGVLAGVAPVLGPISADEMVARGQSVTISASQFAALVASLRKAGVPL